MRERESADKLDRQQLPASLSQIDPGWEALHTPHALFLTRVCLCAIGCLPLSHRMGELLGGQWVAPHHGEIPLWTRIREWQRQVKVPVMGKVKS